jgi:hypothetical protein
MNFDSVVIPVVLAFLTANVMQKKLAKQDEAP